MIVLTATVSAEGRQLNGGPFPATVWAEGRQLNGGPSFIAMAEGLPNIEIARHQYYPGRRLFARLCLIGVFVPLPLWRVCRVAGSARYLTRYACSGRDEAHCLRLVW